MEIEYKWDMPDVKLADRLLASPGLAEHITSHDTIRMCATYYDTPDKLVREMGGGLRIRQENSTSVCCLKLSVLGSDGCKTRREYEVPATDIVEGLRLLAQAGAPADVCERLAVSSPEPSCETDFIRQAYRLEFAGFSAELAIDNGEMRREGRTAPISEIELEFLDGLEEAFHACALMLQDKLALEPLPLSKLARAAAL